MGGDINGRCYTCFFTDGTQEGACYVPDDPVELWIDLALPLTWLEE